MDEGHKKKKNNKNTDIFEVCFLENGEVFGYGLDGGLGQRKGSCRSLIINHCSHYAYVEPVSVTSYSCAKNREKIVKVHSQCFS